MALIRNFAPVVLTVTGIAALGVGAGLIFVPAGLIVVGAALAGAGLFVDFEAGP